MIGLSRRGAALVSAAALLLVSGCSTTSHLAGTAPGTIVTLHGMPQMTLPHDEDLASKATGQYEFEAKAPNGQTLYGILPLHVNGGTMAASILFFAPALFIGGFRDTYPFYEFDPDAGVLRYKTREQDEWRSYKPLQVESERAKGYFAANRAPCPAGAVSAPARAPCDARTAATATQ
jgi:hypothetical protein